QKRSLCLVFAVLDACLALQHPPRLAALDAEERQLARDRPVLDVAVRALDLDVHPEVWHVRAMVRIEAAAIDDVLLRESDEHVFERDQPGGVVLLDLLEMVAESRFSGAPVGDSVAVRLARSLELRFVPIHVNRWIALDVQGFLIGLAEARVEDEFGSATRV